MDMFDKYSKVRYFTYDEILKEKVYRNNSDFKDVDIKSWWRELVKYRKANSSRIHLKDVNGDPMKFFITDQMKSNIEEIEASGKGRMDSIIGSDIKGAVLLESIIDEAFNSSVIEGAYSTRKRASEMITKNQVPKNKSEKMILNNYKAIVYTLENIDKRIDHELIYDVWKTITEDTLDDDEITDSYRNDAVYVNDKMGNVIHEGPDYREVRGMMDELIEFMYKNDGMHPIIKSIIIHYFFVYVHPFFDGNGRTARVLMNMYLIQSGYEFFKYTAMSKLTNENRRKYYDSIKNCEGEDNDVTYFLDFYAGTLAETVREVMERYFTLYCKKALLKQLEDQGIVINKRQLKVIDLLMKNKSRKIDIKEYSKRYKVVQETSRKDLQILVDLGILMKDKKGKKYIYFVGDLKDFR